LAEQNGVDYGTRCDCRVCQYDRFYVDMGQGTVNDEPVGVMTVRCVRCGTPLGHYQVDWKASNRPEDKVTIKDGIIREPSLLKT